MRDLWRRRNLREKLLLLVCVLVVGVAVWLVLEPSSASSSRMLPAAEARRTTRELERQVASIKADTQRLQAGVVAATYDDPPERLVPKVVRLLQDRARDAGIHLREVKPLRARRTGTLTRLPLSVRFTTTAFAPSVVRFLYDLEDPAGKLTVAKYTVTASDPKTRTVEVEVQVVLFTRGGAADTPQGA